MWFRRHQPVFAFAAPLWQGRALVAVALLLGLVCFAATAVAEPVLLRIGTWNVRNYMAMDRHYDGHYRRDYPKPEAEKAALREILLEVRPDVLVLQEIGGAAYLRELQADLKREGLDYPYSLIAEEMPEPEQPAAQRSLAVLSRIAWADSEQAELTINYFKQRQKLLRPPLEVVFEMPGGTRWSLFTVHLKSRYSTRKDDPESAIFRTAEATAVRNHIAKKYPADYPYLIAGDFNDTQNSATVRRFLTRGERTLSKAVAAVDSRGELWTYYWDKEATYQRVDFILASPPMLNFVREGFIADNLPASRRASDHRLVYVDLAF